MNDKLAKPTIAPDSTSSDGHGPCGPGMGSISKVKCSRCERRSRFQTRV